MLKKLSISLLFVGNFIFGAEDTSLESKLPLRFNYPFLDSLKFDSQAVDEKGNPKSALEQYLDAVSEKLKEVRSRGENGMYVELAASTRNIEIIAHGLGKRPSFDFYYPHRVEISKKEAACLYEALKKSDLLVAVLYSQGIADSEPFVVDAGKYGDYKIWKHKYDQNSYASPCISLTEAAESDAVELDSKSWRCFIS